MLGAVSLGILSLWLQVKGRPRQLSLGADTLAISLTFIALVMGIAYEEPFRYSYRIAMIYMTQTWVMTLALMQVRVAFSTISSIGLYGAAVATGTIPYVLIKEVLPYFFADAIKNPDTYVQIALSLSTLSILGAYATIQRLLPLAEQSTAFYRSCILKALIRAAIMQFLCLALLLIYVYLLKHSQYWAAKLITLPFTFGIFGTYAIHRWITGTLPERKAAETDLSPVDITPSTPSITTVTSQPHTQNQTLGRP